MATMSITWSTATCITRTTGIVITTGCWRWPDPTRFGTGAAAQCREDAGRRVPVHVSRIAANPTSARRTLAGRPSIAFSPRSRTVGACRWAARGQGPAASRPNALDLPCLLPRQGQSTVSPVWRKVTHLRRTCRRCRLTSFTSKGRHQRGGERAGGGVGGSLGAGRTGQRARPGNAEEGWKSGPG